MKKLFKWFGILVVLLIVALVCVTLFWLGPVVKTSLETIGPKVTGVDVKVERVAIFPLRGIANVHGLFIGNPDGFSTPSAVELQEFKAVIDLKSLKSDTVIIREILIDSAAFTYERKLKTDNFKEIQKNVEAFAGTPAPKEKPAEKPAEESVEDKPEKKVIIEHLLIRDAVVTAKIPGLPATPFKLETIEKHGIGKEEGGTSYGQASVEILGAVYHSITKAVSNIGSATGDLIKGTEEVIKSTGEAIKNTGEISVETGAEAVKGLDGLLKKKK